MHNFFLIIIKERRRNFMSLRDFIFPRDKSAWDKMQDQSKLDSTRYRDVHGTQQIERGK